MTRSRRQQLKDSGQRHGGRNWDEIAALIPGQGEGSVGADGEMFWILASIKRKQPDMHQLVWDNIPPIIRGKQD
jgi:hypothetical protein